MAYVGSLKMKLQLVCGDVIAMGPGKADLLEAIERTGSISAAGRALGMSYRRAWVLADEMNRCWADRLVATRSGGGDQSGARLTELGRRVLDAYRGLEGALAETADGAALASLSALLRPEPAASAA